MWRCINKSLDIWLLFFIAYDIICHPFSRKTILVIDTCHCISHWCKMKLEFLYPWLLEIIWTLRLFLLNSLCNIFLFYGDLHFLHQLPGKFFTSVKWLYNYIIRSLSILTPYHAVYCPYYPRQGTPCYALILCPCLVFVPVRCTCMDYQAMRVFCVDHYGLLGKVKNICGFQFTGKL